MTERDRRVALLGGVTILVAVLVLRVLPWSIRTWRIASAHSEQSRVLLVETREALSALPRMEDSMRTLTGAVAAMGPRLLSGGSRESAISDLTARVTSLAGWHHAAIVNLTSMPDASSAGSLRRIRTTILLQSDFRGAAGMIRSLAHGSVATVLEQVKITGLESGSPSSVPEKLQIELLVSAWYLATEVPS